MMITYDRFCEILDELCEELPEAFFDELSRGIVVSEEAKGNPAGPNLSIMGEYQNNGPLGRGIVIYFGSFERVYGGLPEDNLKEKMRSTLRHEFRHHMEARSGLRDLEIIDKMQLEKMTGKERKD
ncbi:MAG: metallopeptidase family protein [Eubacteriaceae bacterium]|nr:metallopeptidase family protein [Eubacteriaceae bacterium]